MRIIWYILLLMCLVLVGCSTVGRRVMVDPGPAWLRPWQRPYTVDGRRYVPLQTADGYREEGLASWYGAEEHGGPTSNGERFDMYRPTAAHKTLPLGCHVRVTNTVNGRQIIVRINDRGPFVSGRIVDLSYQAAKELDMLAAGVTPVALEVVMTDARASGPVSRAAEGSSYTLQVAAYGDRQTADQVAARLAAQHPPASIQVAQTGVGTMYRVRTGKFPSRAAAEAARVSLWESGYPGAFIVAE